MFTQSNVRVCREHRPRAGMLPKHPPSSTDATPMSLTMNARPIQKHSAETRNLRRRALASDGKKLGQIERVPRNTIRAEIGGWEGERGRRAVHAQIVY